jgi:hypothetical protein
MNTTNGSTIGRWIVGLSLLWPLLVGFTLLSLYPDYPKNRLQWTLVIVFGPPANLLFEALGGWIFSKEHSERISKSKFSIVRIAFGVVVLSVLFAIGTAITWVIKK